MLTASKHFKDEYDDYKYDEQSVAEDNDSFILFSFYETFKHDQETF